MITDSTLVITVNVFAGGFNDLYYIAPSWPSKELQLQYLVLFKIFLDQFLQMKNNLVFEIYMK